MIDPENAAFMVVSPKSDQATGCGKEVDKKIIGRIGRLTRVLHDSLRELGYDTRLQQANSELSDSKDRLAYVIGKTTKAAEDCLLAVEKASPIQESLSANAVDLAKQWSQAFDTAQTTTLDQLRSRRH